ISLRALKRETGARALRAVLDELMLDKLYDLPENEHNGLTFILDADAVRDNTPLGELQVRNNQKESA
ncbi:MAG: ATP-dependent Clp protease ATP-binding subunit ClpX, partial [Planctomycetota bacterium]|nr:ATP-dependent Clp protease ATP-binding subunit ClpX [Planctomycetota bacterium]